MTESNLERFASAQAEIYDRVISELRQGQKTSHWMWFVFPQIAGLGHSAMARHYAIVDLAEARAYLEHPLLGMRLVECAQAVLAWSGRRRAEQIFGHIDAMKLRSCATLFEEAGGGAVFGAVIEAYFSGIRDPATLTLLE